MSTHTKKEKIYVTPEFCNFLTPQFKNRYVIDDAIYPKSYINVSKNTSSFYLYCLALMMQGCCIM